MRITPFLMLLGALFVNCATLNPVSANSCGNGVLEPGEDCDSTSKSCGAPTSGVQACHFVCATTADCTAGASCSADGVCRTPAGTFASLMIGVSSNVTTLLAGDFDGDKRTDIIGSPPYGSAGSSRVHYFDGNSAVATITALDLPIPLATVKDLDGDGLDDLGFAIRNLGFGAFGALKGQRDRTFATVLYPAATFPATDAKWTVVTNGPNVTLPGTALSCAFGLLSTPSGAGTRVQSVCDGSTGAAGEFDLTIDVAPADLVGDPQFGVIESKTSSCGQLVYATASAVYVLPLCSPITGDWLNAAPSQLRGTLNSDVITGLYVGAVSSVDASDVLIRTTSGNEYVYSYDPTDPANLNRFRSAMSLASAGSLPLASGDLNADDVVDFVFPNGIALSQQAATLGDAGASATRIAPRDNLAWQYAKIGRFNDDEFPDVLVSFVGQLDVDVLGNSGDGRFTPFTIRTDAIVRGIGKGDFDGDRIDDVAFLQSNQASATGPVDNPGDLYIAFGSSTGAPETAHLVGSLKNAHGLLSLKDGSIGVDDLTVVGTSPSTTGDQSAVTVLFGTGARTQVAPLFMIDQPTGATTKPGGTTSIGAARGATDETAHYWQPASFSIGQFASGAGLSIVSVAGGYDYTATNSTYGTVASAVWTAPHDDNAVGNLLPFKNTAPLGSFVTIDQDALENGKFELDSVTASGDLDYPIDPSTGEVDELVTLTRAVIDPSMVAVWVVPPGDPPLSPIVRVPNASVVGSDTVQIVDVTGDHKPDITFIITADGVRKLFIMRGDGNGSFDPPIAVASVPLDAMTFAPINTGKAHLELAVVSPSKVVLASLAGVSSDLADSANGTFTGITVGDFNGDGVQDIAVADNGLIRLMPQRFVGQAQ